MPRLMMQGVRKRFGATLGLEQQQFYLYSRCASDDGCVELLEPTLVKHDDAQVPATRSWRKAKVRRHGRGEALRLQDLEKPRKLFVLEGLKGSSP